MTLPATSLSLRGRYGPWGVLLLLLAASLYLALNRALQVDEAQVTYMARVLGAGQSSEFFTTAPLYTLGPFSAFTASATSSSTMFTVLRVVFWVLFWINLVLLVRAAGEQPWTTRGAWLLVATGTLAPWWDFGFEIRHDNLLLTGLLLCWCLARPASEQGPWRYAWIGFLAVLMQFCAFKAFMYCLPLLVLLVSFPHPHFKATRGRLAVAWLAGAIAGLAVVRGAYALAGGWDVFLVGLRMGARVASEVVGFSPWRTVSRLLVQTPLLLAVYAWVCVVAARGLLVSLRDRRLWDDHHAELLFSLAAVAALLINPTPFPYNLLLVVPFLFLAVVTAVGPRPAALRWPEAARGVAIVVLVCWHGVPFVLATWRHLDRPIGRQFMLMEMAESLTDPVRDRVFDGIGMVPTRKSVQFFWYYHSLAMRMYGTTELPTLSDALRVHPAAVVIQSYRTDWLPPPDKAFIDQHYLPLADDFWVLGTKVQDGGMWECLHEGRYQVRADRGAPVPVVTLDGQPLPGQPTLITKGKHRLGVSPAGSAFLVWSGPRANAPQSLPPGDHEALFLTWY